MTTTVNLLVIAAMIVFVVAMFWALVHATSCSERAAESTRTMYHNHREEREGKEKPTQVDERLARTYRHWKIVDGKMVFSSRIPDESEKPSKEMISRREEREETDDE